jgi:hypothetical protein
MKQTALYCERNCYETALKAVHMEITVFWHVTRCIYSFICGLFIDAESSVGHTASNGKMINQLERMWKKLGMSCFKVLSEGPRKISTRRQYTTKNLFPAYAYVYSSPFTELEGSLLHSQGLTTGPYPEPHESRGEDTTTTTKVHATSAPSVPVNST